jgi:hypothetical protein
LLQVAAVIVVVVTAEAVVAVAVSGRTYSIAVYSACAKFVEH